MLDIIKSTFGKNKKFSSRLDKPVSSSLRRTQFIFISRNIIIFLASYLLLFVDLNRSLFIDYIKWFNPGIFSIYCPLNHEEKTQGVKTFDNMGNKSSRTKKHNNMSDQ